MKVKIVPAANRLNRVLEILATEEELERIKQVVNDAQTTPLGLGQADEKTDSGGRITIDVRRTRY